MKIIEYGTEEKVEKTVRLAFRETYNGIVVHAVDVKGRHIDSGDIVKFRNDGRIERKNGINSTLGFQLDEKGRVKEDE